MVVVGVSLCRTPGSGVIFCGGTTGVGDAVEVEGEDASGS